MKVVLKSRKFRRLLFGRAVTNFGDSIYFIAAMWLVYDLTNDPIFSGIAGFLTLGPSALQMFVGPLVDRFPIRRVLIWTQLLQAVVVGAIPVAYYFGKLSVWTILFVMPLVATLQLLTNPAQSAALPRFLDDEDLTDANSAFSMARQTVDMIGNGITGLLIAAFGAITLFAVDVVSFLIAALTFATVYISPASASPDDPSPEADTEGILASYLADLRDGIEVLRGTFLLKLIVGAGILNFAAGSIFTVLPAYANTFNDLAGAGAYGILMGSLAAGKLVGALSASYFNDYPFGRLLLAGSLLTGVVWLVAVGVNSILFTPLLIAVAFVPTTIVNINFATVTQSAPPNEYIGRVSSLIGTITGITMPLGLLFGGFITSELGPTIGMYFYLCAPFGMAAFVLLFPTIRRLPRTNEITLEQTETSDDPMCADCGTTDGVESRMLLSNPPSAASDNEVRLCVECHLDRREGRHPPETDRSG